MPTSVTSAHFAITRIDHGAADYVGIGVVPESRDIFIPLAQLSELSTALLGAIGAGGLFTGSRFLVRPTNTTGRPSIDISYVGGVGYLLSFLNGYLTELSDLVLTAITAYNTLNAYDLDGSYADLAFARAAHRHTQADIDDLQASLVALDKISYKTSAEYAALSTEQRNNGQLYVVSG